MAGHPDDKGKPRLSRRGFLGTSTAATAAATAIGAGIGTGWRADVRASEATAVHPRTWKQRPPNLIASACDMCGAQCPMWVQTQGGRPIALHANGDSLYTGGHLCGKAYAGLQKTQLASRLTTPLLRNAQGILEPVGWAQAIDFIAQRLVRIEKKYGAHAIQVHRSMSSQPKIWDVFWKKLVGTPNVFGNDSVCDGTRKSAFGLTMGEKRPLPDLQNTRFGVCLGVDYLSSTKYLWYASQIMTALDKGARFWVVDPRFSATAARAVQYGGRWIPINPGTDALLGMAIGKVVLEEAANFRQAFSGPASLLQLTNGRLEGSPLTRGFPGFRTRLENIVLDDAAKETGVARKDIVAMAKGLLREKRSLLDAWTGVTKKSNGFQTARVFACVAAMTGSIGNEGGLNIQTKAKLGGAKTVLTLAELRESLGLEPLKRDPAAPKKPGEGVRLVQAGGFLRFVPSDCSALIPQAILDPLSIPKQARARRGSALPAAAQGYPVKGLISASRNLSNGNAGSNLWRRALDKLLADPDGLVVDVNLFVSDHGARSHVVLPEASHMERFDLFKPNGLWPSLHVRTPATSPAGDSKTMYSIVTMLADALGSKGYGGLKFAAKDVIEGDSYEDIVRLMLDSPRADWKPRLKANEGKAFDPKRPRGVLQNDGSRVTFEGLSEEGAWQPTRADDRTPRYHYFAEVAAEGFKGFGQQKGLGKFTKTFDFDVPALGGDAVGPTEVGPVLAMAAAKFVYPDKEHTHDSLPDYVRPRYGRPTKGQLVLNTAGKNQWNSSSKTVHIPMVTALEPYNLMTMHPTDAGERGIRDRSLARVHNSFGSVEVRVAVSAGIMPGSLHLASGFGQREPATDAHARMRGANANALTDNGNVDPVAGGEGAAEVTVFVEAIR